MKPLTIRRAVEADTPTVVDMWNEASGWLADREMDQWQYPIKMYNVNKAIADRACWVVDRADGIPVGTITIDTHADPELWLPTDKPHAAIYLHRLVVSLAARGNNIGASILDWAGVHAQTLGKSFIRLDAWTTNERLHQYYRDHGFNQIRTVRAPHIISGVCFERSSAFAEALGPPIIETLFDLCNRQPRLSWPGQI